VPTPPVTVNPSSLSFNWQTGIASPNPSQTFNINTSASQPLNFFISTSYDGTGSWVSVVNPNSGSTNAGGSTPIRGGIVVSADGISAH
jgi:hypothetical protein